MGLTERHWFEDEEPTLTDRQLEDLIEENKRWFERGKAQQVSEEVHLPVNAGSDK